jgi:hypothetical protein
MIDDYSRFLHGRIIHTTALLGMHLRNTKWAAYIWHDIGLGPGKHGVLMYDYSLVITEFHE